MAKIIEHVIGVKISKIVPDDNEETLPFNEEQYVTLVSGLTELSVSLLNDPGCIIEIGPIQD